MGFFSQELKVMDDNTVKYMVDALSAEVDTLTQQKEVLSKENEALSKDNEILKQKLAELEAQLSKEDIVKTVDENLPL